MEPPLLAMPNLANAPQIFGSLYARNFYARAPLAGHGHLYGSIPRNNDSSLFNLADGMGFEPTDAFTSPVFKTGAFNHSAISPCAQKHDRLKRRTYSTTLRAACQRISELPGMFFCSLSRERRKKGRERLYKPPALCYTMYKPWSIHGLFVCCAGPMGPCVHV